MWHVLIWVKRHYGDSLSISSDGEWDGEWANGADPSLILPSWVDIVQAIWPDDPVVDILERVALE